MDKSLVQLEAIFWDFDGVLLNSNSVRDRGFEEVLKEYPKNEVSQLMNFHRSNGGLSRYVKFGYFFEEVRKESVSQREIEQWANRFSVIMRKKLTRPDLLIQETVSYIKNNYRSIPMYIVSGSDQAELRYLCQNLDIASYFQRIHGSPKPKKAWVKTILTEEKLVPAKCILIGDSINDFDAAESNGVKFMGYNNPSVEKRTNYALDI